jgi:hypothetical protein
VQCFDPVTASSPEKEFFRNNPVLLPVILL